MPSTVNHRVFECFLVGLFLLVNAGAVSGFDAVNPATSKTEVFVLGMIHGGHTTSKLWGLDQVRETIKAINPDVICPEIPPANCPGT